MNIFVLDWDHRKCATYHNDKHVVKMILETAQLLCGVHWVNGGQAPYKLSHQNHPCAKWVREDISNYRWLCELGIALSKEYQHRYGKAHKSLDIIMWCLDNQPHLPNNGLTIPPAAMPDQYKVPGNIIQSYRNYYMGEKASIAKWKNRKKPTWFN